MASSHLSGNRQLQSTEAQMLTTNPEFIACHHGLTDCMIRVDNIIYASTKDSFNVINIVAEYAEYKYHVSMSLKNLCQFNSLKRCHDQNIVNINKILRIEKKPNKTSGIIYTISGHTVDIGRTYMGSFFKLNRL